MAAGASTVSESPRAGLWTCSPALAWRGQVSSTCGPVTPVTGGLQVKQTALQGGTVGGHSAKEQGILHSAAGTCLGSGLCPHDRPGFQEVSPGLSTPPLLGLFGR